MINHFPHEVHAPISDNLAYNLACLDWLHAHVGSGCHSFDQGLERNQKLTIKWHWRHYQGEVLFFFANFEDSVNFALAWT